jgi:hypothetical protein
MDCWSYVYWAFFRAFFNINILRLNNSLHLKMSRLLVFGLSCLFACQAQLEGETAKSAGASPATATMPQPTAGPVNAA